MAGFVECLDNEEAEEGTEKGDGERQVPHQVCKTYAFVVPSSALVFNTDIFILILISKCVY